jgi:hypothetical protein
MTGSSPSPGSHSEDQEPIDAEIVPTPAPTPPAPDIPAFAPPAPDYDDHGVPSFDFVRDKIEGRFATSIGAAELAGETPQGRSIEEQEAERAKAAKAKLDEIRRSLGQ